MNDEIKEKMTIGKAKKILRGFLAKDCYYDTPLYYAIPYILEYINELQQENQELNDSNQWWNNRFNAIQRDYEDYKSRIEKAVEYIEDVMELTKECPQDLLDILNGKE